MDIFPRSREIPPRVGFPPHFTAPQGGGISAPGGWVKTKETRRREKKGTETKRQRQTDGHKKTETKRQRNGKRDTH